MQSTLYLLTCSPKLVEVKALDQGLSFFQQYLNLQLCSFYKTNKKTHWGGGEPIWSVWFATLAAQSHSFSATRPQAIFRH